MTSSMSSLRLVTIVAAFIGVAGVRFASAQNIRPNVTTVTTGPSTSAPANMDAEREQIWNSADMLRARAWLKDYCAKSAKVTPEMAKQYEAELASMTPNQMRIYLMKFDEEEQQRQQQYAMFQQGNQYAMQQAMAAHKQTQQAYAALNQSQTAAAQNAQQQVSEQRENAQSNQENKRMDQGTYPSYPGGYGYGPYGFSPYGYGGGVQYHYHLYGN
jgi:hypothetical protein